MGSTRRQDAIVVAVIAVLVAVALTLLILASRGVFSPSQGPHPCPAFGC